MNAKLVTILFLSLSLTASNVGATAFVLDGGSLDANLIPWGGDGYVYPLAFDASASGGLDITFYGIDGAFLRFNNIDWGGSLKGTGIAGVTAGTAINSIDPPNNSVWSYMINQNSPSGNDWNGNATSTLGPDGISLTIDDTRSWLFQSWFRPSTGEKTGHPGYGDPAYNIESYITPNPRFPSAPALSASYYNRFDIRLNITPDGNGNYTAERWVRMHNSAATMEGAYWVYNTALNNSSNAWIRFENEAGIYTFPMTDIDLTSVHPFVGIGNWETSSQQVLNWLNVVVNGTPAFQPEVWVDDAWLGLPNGYSVSLPTGGTGYIGYNAFYDIQSGINAVEIAGTVHVAAGVYTEQVSINKALDLEGTGEPTIQCPAGPLVSYKVSESAARFEPVVLAYGGVNDGAGNISGPGTIEAAISGFNINGLNRGSVNRFVGIMARNCDASSISDNNIFNMLYSSGMPQTSGILIYGNSDIQIEDNIVNDWSRGGIIANGDDGPLPDPVVAIVNNIVAGEGPLPVGNWAQNGIQIGYGAAGSIINNQVSDIACLDPNWSASALLLYFPSPGIVVTGNNIHNTQGALNAYYVDNLTLNNNAFAQNDFAFIWGGNLASVLGNTFTGNSQALYISDATNCDINGNTFDGNDYAIIADGACETVSFSANNIAGSTIVGALIQPYGPSPTGVSFHGNNISGNAYGIENTTSNMIDGTANWWGDTSGPNNSITLGLNLNSARPRQITPSEGPAKIKPASLSIADNSNTHVAGSKGDLALGNGDGISELIDYSPWWKADYVGNLHSTPWTWGIDQSNSSTIQEGIGLAAANDIIDIAPGLYEEQVVIAKNGLSLIGAGSESDPALNTIIRSPATLSYYFTTSANNFPIVGIHDISGASLQNCRIDGAGRGNGNYRFVGIGFWNAGGTVSNCYITGIQDTPFSGAQHGNGIYAYNNTGGPYSLNLTNDVINDAQKNGMTLSGTGLIINLSDCAVSGHGPTNITAQNGIQISYGAGGTVSNCDVSGIAYGGESWIASGMLFYNASPVNVINGSSVTGGQACLVYQETNGSINDITIQTNGVNNEEGISIRDYGYQLKSNFGEKTAKPIAPFEEDFTPANNLQTNTGTNITISNATLLGADFASSYGIACWSLGGPDDDVTVNINDSRIEHWELGVVSYDGGGGGAIDVSANHNQIANNTAMGFWTNATAEQNASGNWWGSYCGPYQATSNQDGAGNEISDNIAYDPWCNQDFTRCDFSNYAIPSVVWVDNDYTVDGANDGHYWCYDAFATIQDGIDAVAANGIVNVQAGIYIEQIVLKKSAQLRGLGNPTIECPSWPLASYTIQENSARFEPIIFAYGGVDNGSGNISGPGTIDVVISGFSIDGNNSGTVNRFAAFLLRNCRNSSITQNNIYEMLYQSGLPTTFGLLVYGNSQVAIDHNIINDWTRNGITANGDDGALPDPIADISNNTLIGEGVLPLGNWAQNGIQLGYGAFGSIANNTITGIAIDDPNWSASAIILYSALPGVVLSGNNIHDCQAGLNAYYTDDVIIGSGNTFSRNDFIYILGADGIRVENNTFSENNQALYLSDVTNASIANNILNANDIGIVADGACSNLVFSGNEITNNITAAAIIQPYGSSPNNVTFRANCIGGNGTGIENTTPNMIHASGNWWGDPAGPSTSLSIGGWTETSRPAKPGFWDNAGGWPSIKLTPDSKGLEKQTVPFEQVESGKRGDIPVILTDGDGISSLVDYSPWWAADYVDDAHTSPWQWRLDPSNSSSIQEALDLASSGDIIYVLQATYTGPGNRDIDFHGKAISLNSFNRNEPAIIDCQSAGRAFHFHSGESPLATIHGFVIKNGAVIGNGGAILCENGSAPRVSFCLLQNNRALGDGGAIYGSESDISLINNTIIWNKAGGSGGGVSFVNSNPVILNTILWDDTAAANPEINVIGESQVSYSDIKGAWLGEGNIDCDPRFCDSDSGDFRVSDISCCMNGGFGGIHIGAYEIGCTGDFLPGDANASGSVNGVDVIYMVNYFKDAGPPFPPPVWRADANGNCLVNGIDVVFLVVYLKGSGVAPRSGDCVLNERKEELHNDNQR